MKELISIIIPTFNRYELLLSTIDSLYLQSHQNWEAIIVDDYSTDGSYHKLLNHLKDKRIKIIQNYRNKGGNTCRNIGIEKSSGKYIIFFDSDDLMHSNCLAQRVEQFQFNLNLDFLVFQGGIFSKNTSIIEKCWGEMNENWDSYLDKIKFLEGNSLWSIAGPIWKKESLIKNNLKFNETLRTSQDWDFNLRSFFVKMKYKKYPNKIDYFVRRDDENLSFSINSKHHQLDTFINRLELYNIYEDLTKDECNALNKNVIKQYFNCYSKLTINENIEIVKKLYDYNYLTNKNIFMSLIQISFIFQKAISFSFLHRVLYRKIILKKYS